MLRKEENRIFGFLRKQLMRISVRMLSVRVMHLGFFPSPSCSGLYLRLRNWHFGAFRYVRRCAVFRCRMLYSTVVLCCVPASSPSCGGDVAVYVPDINQSSLPTSFYSVPVSFSVFMSFSTYIIQ